MREENRNGKNESYYDNTRTIREREKRSIRIIAARSENPRSVPLFSARRSSVKDLFLKSLSKKLPIASRGPGFFP